MPLVRQYLKTAITAYTPNNDNPQLQCALDPSPTWVVKAGSATLPSIIAKDVNEYQSRCVSKNFLEYKKKFLVNEIFIILRTNPAHQQSCKLRMLHRPCMLVIWWSNSPSAESAWLHSDECQPPTLHPRLPLPYNPASHVQFTLSLLLHWHLGIIHLVVRIAQQCPGVLCTQALLLLQCDFRFDLFFSFSFSFSFPVSFSF